MGLTCVCEIATLAGVEPRPEALVAAVAPGGKPPIVGTRGVRNTPAIIQLFQNHNTAVRMVDNTIQPTVKMCIEDSCMLAEIRPDVSDDVVPQKVVMISIG